MYPPVCASATALRSSCRTYLTVGSSCSLNTHVRSQSLSSRVYSYSPLKMADVWAVGVIHSGGLPVATLSTVRLR